MQGAPRKRRLIGEINVVPLIDVMLVLLVIFMATAPLLTQGVDVELPKASATPLPQRQKDPALVLSIDREGGRFLNIGKEAKRPLDDAALKTAVAAALAAAPERDVMIKADTNVPYGRVIGAVVILQQAGATRLGFLTSPQDAEAGRAQ